ncbi:uncharacterized protein VB005_01888 [Metarhizium brunneum]
MSSDDLLEHLADQKPQFVDDACSKVYFYIVCQHRRVCLAIVEKDAYGAGQDRIHRPGVDSYLKVLTYFCLKKDYHGHALDSALSEPVVNIICESYADLMDQNSLQVKDYLYKKISGDRMVLEKTMAIVMEKLGAKGLRLGQEKLAGLVHHAISQTVVHAAHTKLGASVSHGAVVVAGSAAGQFLAKMLMQAIMHHINYIMTHIMSSVAVKATVKAVAKKLLLVSVTGVVVKSLAAKFGITSAASAFHVIGWTVLGGYLAYKAFGLPEEMAEKVSDGVRDTLNDNYRPCLEQICDDLAKSALDPEKLGAAMIGQLTDFTDWQRELESGVDVSNQSLPRLEHDVRDLVGRSWEWATRRK